MLVSSEVSSRREKGSTSSNVPKEKMENLFSHWRSKSPIKGCQWNVESGFYRHYCAFNLVRSNDFLPFSDCGDKLCEIKRQTRIADKSLYYIERGCHITSSTECTKDTIKETCYQVCDTDLCNSNKDLVTPAPNGATAPSSSFSVWASTFFALASMAWPTLRGWLST